MYMQHCCSCAGWSVINLHSSQLPSAKCGETKHPVLYPSAGLVIWMTSSAEKRKVTNLQFTNEQLKTPEQVNFLGMTDCHHRHHLPVRVQDLFL